MKLILIAFILGAVLDCSGDDELDCSTVLCAGSPSILLQISDVDTGDRYFQNMDISTAPEGLSLTFVSDNTELLYGQNFTINELGELIIFQYLEDVDISLENEFSTVITAESVTTDTDDCCPTIDLENIQLSDGNFTVEADNFSYTIALSI